MAEIKLYNFIPDNFFPEVLHKHCDGRIDVRADFKITIPVDQLPFNIEYFSDKEDDYTLYFESTDIKNELEAVTDSFFSTLYPNCKITIGAHFDERGCFSFDFHLYSRRLIYHDSDIELSVAEMEHVRHALEQYAEAHNISLPGKSQTWRERLSNELEETLRAYVDGMPSDMISMITKYVREDILDHLEADEEQRKHDTMDGDLAAKYFWEAIRRKLPALLPET